MRVLNIITFLLILSFESFASDECHHNKNTFRCVKYIKNYDGDSITFDIPRIHPIIGKKVVVRIRGIDAPEIRTKNKCEKSKARTAKKLVRSILKKAKKVNLHNISRGKYFRIVADVFVDGKPIKDLIIKNGLAYKYQGGTKPKIDWCVPLRKLASPK